jgi:hypothetical protein
MKWLHAFPEVVDVMAGLDIFERNNGLVVPVASRDAHSPDTLIDHIAF